MAPLDPQTRARLDLLRQGDVAGVYASDEPSEGSDPGGALTLVLDPTHRVEAVRVTQVQPLRRPDRLRAAVDAAYAAAIGARLAASPRRSTRAPGERPVAQRLTLSVRPVTPDLLERHRVRAEDDGVRRRTGPVTGVSRNGCVTVSLAPTSPRGDVDADPGWLAQATAGQVAAALTEAFTDAYTRSDHR